MKKLFKKLIKGVFYFSIAVIIIALVFGGGDSETEATDKVNQVKEKKEVKQNKGGGAEEKSIFVNKGDSIVRVEEDISETQKVDFNKQEVSASKADYIIKLDPLTKRTENSTIIEMSGKVINNTGKEFKTVQFDLILYNKEGEEINRGAINVNYKNGNNRFFTTFNDGNKIWSYKIKHILSIK